MRLQRLVYVTPSGERHRAAGGVPGLVGRTRAERVRTETQKEYACPLTFAHVVVATPERASAAVHMIETNSLTW